MNGTPRLCQKGSTDPILHEAGLLDKIQLAKVGNREFPTHFGKCKLPYFPTNLSLSLSLSIYIYIYILSLISLSLSLSLHVSLL